MKKEVKFLNKVEKDVKFLNKIKKDSRKISFDFGLHKIIDLSLDLAINDKNNYIKALKKPYISPPEPCDNCKKKIKDFDKSIMVLNEDDLEPLFCNLKCLKEYFINGKGSN